MHEESLSRLARLLALLLALALAGCDGGNDDGDDGGAGGSNGDGDGNSQGPTRGQLIEKPPELVRSIAAGELLSDLSDPVRQALLLQAGSPVCDIAVHKIRYRTGGGAGEDTTASGALMVPTGGGETRCRGARPMVLYAHGTTTNQQFDMTRLGGQEDAEGLNLAAFFAAQGYIVVAPNYAGYDTSTLGYHPYLVADQQSKDMIDALTAARSALPTSSAPDTTDAGRLYVTGYSQGGYVAMATHRALEQSGAKVTASVPMSGPYALAAFVDAVFAGRVMRNASAYTTLLLTSYQESYGNTYSTAAEVFEAPYASSIETQPLPDGSLPDALFDSTPPDPQFADITPATTPENLASVFRRGFGTFHLIRNSFRLSYLQDAQANPDRGWPDTTTAEPAANPQLNWRQQLKRNDLRDWTPAAPTLLCGGHDDPTVFWLNTQLMQSYWAAKAPSAPYTILDVDAAPTGDDDPYAGTKRRFAIAKDLVATADGDDGVLDVYHGLVAPFCFEAAKDFIARQERTQQ